MMELNFNKGLVQKGTKVTNEASPVLRLLSTYNSFKLNNKAAKLLDVDKGDTVYMIDLIGQEGITQANRYYICTAAGRQDGAKISEGRSFNYSSIYSTILANDEDITSITPDVLVAKGLAVKTEHKNGHSYVATKTMEFEIVEFNEGEPVQIAEDYSAVVYGLKFLLSKDHDPQVAEDESFDMVSDEEVED